ncbi:hypothetical protein ALC56_09909 [Trachymyrmex septentrionalis]|uniref:Uncharacterized protein n=1 Tax=Trachymyrmex septentrionalis TaxID=34720 RepID=A0A195F6M6_9HYME|nr:hypothetical protein ALC56_09909 [Trachymyrmex septentrionalis]
MFIPRVNNSTRRMAVRHYAHQYTMRLVDEKIIDGNVSENSDAEDYYPLIHHSANDTMVSANARRQPKEAGWIETNSRGFDCVEDMAITSSRDLAKLDRIRMGHRFEV